MCRRTVASRVTPRSSAGNYNTHSEVYAMRTNIVLDDGLVKEAITLSGARTKREVVDIALRELVARRRQRQMK